MIFHALEGEAVRVNYPVDGRQEGHKNDQSFADFEGEAGLGEGDNVGHVDDLHQESNEKCDKLSLDRFDFLFHDGLRQNFELAVEIDHRDQVYHQQKDAFGEVDGEGGSRRNINLSEVDEEEAERVENYEREHAPVVNPDVPVHLLLCAVVAPLRTRRQQK